MSDFPRLLPQNPRDPNLLRLDYFSRLIKSKRALLLVALLNTAACDEADSDRPTGATSVTTALTPSEEGDENFESSDESTSDGEDSEDVSTSEDSGTTGDSESESTAETPESESSEEPEDSSPETPPLPGGVEIEGMESEAIPYDVPIESILTIKPMLPEASYKVYWMREKNNEDSEEETPILCEGEFYSSEWQCHVSFTEAQLNLEQTVSFWAENEKGDKGEKSSRILTPRE